MGLYSKLAAVSLASMTLVMVASMARGVVPWDATPAVEGLHRVLDQPILLSRRVEVGPAGEKFICFELGWVSRWQGGPLEIRGSLILEHRHHPVGRIVACLVDPARLASHPRWAMRLPWVEGEQGTMMLAHAELADLRVRFSSTR